MTALSHILPTILVYFLMAMLAVIPRTRALRVVLCSVATLLAFRLVASIDMSIADPNQRSDNSSLVCLVVFMVIRMLDWTLARGPLVRHLRPAKAAQSTIMDALDLAFTFRGHGWEWSRGVHIPRETRPADHRGFTFRVIRSVVAHAFLYSILDMANRSFCPSGTEAAGGSIFDDTLPFHVRHLRASIISASAALTMYAFLQLCYDTCTLFAVLFLGHAPEQWPPAFDAPWRATSLSDFWGHRWQQFVRRLFLVAGGYPLAHVFGRAGLVCGTFLASAAFHHVWVFVYGGAFGEWRILAGFCTFPPAVLAEYAFKQATGRRVGGVAGWVWTMAWLYAGGSLIIDGFARAGLLGRLGLPEPVFPNAGAFADFVAQHNARLCVAA